MAVRCVSCGFHGPKVYKSGNPDIDNEAGREAQIQWAVQVVQDLSWLPCGLINILKDSGRWESLTTLDIAS